jgi:cell division protein FtsW
MLNNNSIYRLYYGWWKNIDKKIFLLIILLFSLGLFFSLVSTSLIASDKLDTNDYFFFFKHLTYIFLVINIIIFF